MSKKSESASVIIQIFGGLGNQMFQYAFGKAVAKALNVPLKGDINYFHRYKDKQLRSYELDEYMLELDLVKPGEVSSLIKSRFYPYLYWLLPGKHYLYLKEQHNHIFDPSLFSLTINNRSVYLDGYWQSYKYFEHIRDDLIRDFTLRTPLSESNKLLLDSILAKNSVSIHIRRGDYVNNPATNSYHGVCPIEYYIRGIKIASQQVSDAHYFVFSDDPEWCKAHLDVPAPCTFVMPDTQNAAIDMYLMSQCSHFIIANSSFSWWGAWLSGNLNKIVIHPLVWLTGVKDTLPMQDFIPEDWIGV